MYIYNVYIYIALVSEKMAGSPKPNSSSLLLSYFMTIFVGATNPGPPWGEKKATASWSGMVRKPPMKDAKLGTVEICEWLYR
jgi:hypothetical protein